MLAVFRALAEPRFRHLACSDLRQEPSSSQGALWEICRHFTCRGPCQVRRPGDQGGKLAKRQSAQTDPCDSKATQEAFERAGMKVMRILEEPVTKGKVCTCFRLISHRTMKPLTR